MKRISQIALFFLLLQPVMATGKKKHTYTSKAVVAISDSLLRSKIGDTLFGYCTFDSCSYYIWQKGDKQHFVALTEKETINKRFASAAVRYRFTMPYSECAAYDTVSGTIDIVVQKRDTVFSLEAGPDTSFIPQIAILNEPCNFLSSEDAMEKAIRDNLKKGITPAYATLEYIPASRQFVWVVQSLLWDERNFNQEREPKKDVVVIEAVSGEILKHSSLLYTQPISDFF